MQTPTEQKRPQGAPPRWLLPTLVGTLVVLAAMLTYAITSGPPAQPAPAAQVPLDQLPAAPAPQAPADAAAEVPPAHGSLNPAGPSVEVIGVAAARERFDAGTAIFIDLRAGTEYAAGHIPGALTITSRELEQRINTLPPGAAIIAYGDATRPDSSQRGAQIFMELGYPTVIALDGGFQAWRDAGYPVESGSL